MGHLTIQDREKLVAVAWYLIGKANQIDYVQIRPALNVSRSYAEVRDILDNGGRIGMDCSESVTCIYKWAGFKDPSGQGFDGWTNSGMMWNYLKEHYTNPADAHPGALVTYGFSGDEHVCMVMEHGTNPMMFSHGSEIGPLFISLADESTAHVGQPITFLNVSGLG